MTPRRDVVIVDGVRTPFCKSWGVLEDVPADELARTALAESMARVDLDPGAVDEVVLGNIAQPAETTTLARVAALRAGVPKSVPAVTLNRNCGSGLDAVATAWHKIESGLADVVLAGGVESMSRIPFQMSQGFTRRVMALRKARTLAARAGALRRFRAKDLRPVAALEVGLRDAWSGLNMGETAEVLARRFQIGREAQDAYAVESHRRAVAGRARLREEIAPLFPPPRHAPVQDDVGPREDQSAEKLRALRPAFDKTFGTVTAGNSCMLTDGAAAVVVAAEERARSLGMPYLGRIRAFAFAGCEPETMGLGPVYAAHLALRRAGLAMRDMQLVEINEAFAAQVLAVLDGALGAVDAASLNVNGGAIALGHPVGCSGTRLVLTLLKEMARRDATYGLAALCIGGGQGAAMIVERS